MAKENGESKLKLIHLVYGLLAAAVVVGISIGSMATQQKVNTQVIEKKLAKDVFEIHQTEQRVQFKSIDKKLDTLIAK